MAAEIIPFQFAKWFHQNRDKARRLSGHVEAWGTLKTLDEMMTWAVEERHVSKSPVTPELREKTRADALGALREFFADLGAPLPEAMSPEKENALLDAAVNAVFTHQHPESQEPESEEQADSQEPKLYAVQWESDRSVSFVYARDRAEAIITLDDWIADCAPEELVEVEPGIAFTVRPRKHEEGFVVIEFEGENDGLHDFIKEEFPSFFKAKKPRRNKP